LDILNIPIKMTGNSGSYRIKVVDIESEDLRMMTQTCDSVFDDSYEDDTKDHLHLSYWCRAGSSCGYCECTHRERQNPIKIWVLNF
jgi:hypothetical protein